MLCACGLPACTHEPACGCALTCWLHLFDHRQQQFVPWGCHLMASVWGRLWDRGRSPVWWWRWVAGPCLYYQGFGTHPGKPLVWFLVVGGSAWLPAAQLRMGQRQVHTLCGTDTRQVPQPLWLGLGAAASCWQASNARLFVNGMKCNTAVGGCAAQPYHHKVTIHFCAACAHRATRSVVWSVEAIIV